jgi:HEAT repeat protein
MPLIRKPASSSTPAEPKPAVDVLAALRSGNKEERWTAARNAFIAPGADDALAAALRTESDARVREAMFTSLARIGSPKSVDALVEFLRSDDAAIRAAALDALRSNVAAIREHLPKLLNDEDSDVRLLSCELVRNLPSEEATRMLCDVLARENEANVCAAAIDVLAEVGRPEALSALSECERRFERTPFLSFAIQIARERIASQTMSRHD